MGRLCDVKSFDVHEKDTKHCSNGRAVSILLLVIFSSLETTDCSNSIINSGEGYALPSAFLFSLKLAKGVENDL